MKERKRTGVVFQSMENGSMYAVWGERETNGRQSVRDWQRSAPLDYLNAAAFGFMYGVGVVEGGGSRRRGGV